MILTEKCSNRNERGIYAQRQNEQKIDRLSSKLKSEFYEKHFASWENKG
jgi:hypothetical protein